MFFLAFQRILFQLLLDIVYFPLWWYTRGFGKVVIGIYHSLEDANASFAPGLWLRNIFTPMYGQRDIEGRLMSVFMRIVNIIGRTIALLIWAFVLWIALLLWLFLPVFFGYMIIRVFLLQ